MPPRHIPKADCIKLFGFFEGTNSKCPNIFFEKIHISKLPDFILAQVLNSNCWLIIIKNADIIETNIIRQISQMQISLTQSDIKNVMLCREETVKSMMPSKHG